jgi:hypothetical protein
MVAAFKSEKAAAFSWNLQRQARRLEQVIDPIAYDVKRPIVEVEEPAAPSGGQDVALDRGLALWLGDIVKVLARDARNSPPASSALRQRLRRSAVAQAGQRREPVLENPRIWRISV